MWVLITYDVNTKSPTGEKRLRQVAKACVNYGKRVQNSVFECSVTPAQLRLIQDKLSKIIDKEKDSVRFYRLGKEGDRRISSMGKNDTYNPDKDLLLM